MAKSELQIVLVDEGGPSTGTGDTSAPYDQPGPAPAPVTGPAARNADGAESTTSKPEDSVSSKPKSGTDDDGKPQREALTRIVDTTANMLGLGGLVDQLKTVTGVFRDVSTAVGRMPLQSRPVPDEWRSPESSTSRLVRDSASSRERPIDAEIVPGALDTTAGSDEVVDAVENVVVGLRDLGAVLTSRDASTDDDLPDAPQIDSGPDTPSPELVPPQPRTPSPSVEVPPIVPTSRAAAPAAGGAMTAAGASAGTAVATTGATGAAAGASGAAGGALLAAATNPVTLALAALAAGAVATTFAVKKLSDAFHAAAVKLEDFSPDVAVAMAENEARRDMAQLRRADRIGPELASVETMRGKFEDKATDLWTEILGILLSLTDVIKPSLERGLSLLDVIVAWTALNKEQIDVLVTIFSGLTDPLNFSLAEIRKELADIPEANRKLGKELYELFTGEDEDDMGPDRLLTLLNNTVAAMPPPRRAPRRGGR